MSIRASFDKIPIGHPRFQIILFCFCFCPPSLRLLRIIHNNK